MRTILLALIILVSICNLVFSQSIWIDPEKSSAFSVELLRPTFDSDRFSNLANLAMFFSVRLRLSEQVWLVGELPLAHMRVDVSRSFFETRQVVLLGVRSETVLGNPYAGLVVFTRDSPVFWEIGVRFPTESGSAVGIAADFDRFEAFIPNLWSAQIKLNRMSKNESNFLTRFTIGPTVLGSTEGGEPQVFLDYGLKLGYDGEKFALMGGVTGRAWLKDLSEGNINLDQRTAHQLGATATLKLGSVRPGVHLRMLIDEDLARLVDADEVEFVVGLNIDLRL